MLVTKAVSSAVPMTLSMGFATLRRWTLFSCNDGTNNCFQADPRRLLRLGLQALARNLLSGWLAAEALVRALRGRVRHGGDQRQLLPRAARVDLRWLAREGTAGLPLCGEGQPLHHPHEEAPRLR